MNDQQFNSILVANRGEIALRVIKAIHALNKKAVAVYSHADRDLPFVSGAGQAFSLGNGGLADTYLNQDRILEIAMEAAVDAIHPGYGFLSENAGFAEKCKNAGIRFIGPDPEIIRIMGDKARAREKAHELGIPVIKGFTGSHDQLLRAVNDLRFPLLIKPSAGGGGKGMRIVHHPDKFEEAAMEAAREAERYFDSGELYAEQLLTDPRHIEVQIMADHHGNTIHLFERECSVQRRYQKIIEESPSGSLSADQRESVTNYALKLVKAIGYTNAGTVEFLMDQSGAFYFLEMNTRIQVEHPVTEMLTGTDLVKEQISVAEGAALSFNQGDIQMHGHVIEARLCAEDPSRDFNPSPGKIRHFRLPGDKGLRVDPGYREGNVADERYDTLLAKILVKAGTRQEASISLSEKLQNVHISGISTNRDFLISLLKSDSFLENRIHTAFIDTESESLIREFQDQQVDVTEGKLPFVAAFMALQDPRETQPEITSPWLTIGRWRMVPEISLLHAGQSYSLSYYFLNGNKNVLLQLEGEESTIHLEKQDGFNYRILLDSRPLELWSAPDGADILLDMDGRLSKFRRRDILDERYPPEKQAGEEETSRHLNAPLNGHILKINFSEGDQVEEGEPLMVIESMKMENKILSPGPCTVSRIHVKKGQQVQNKQILISLEYHE